MIPFLKPALQILCADFSGDLKKFDKKMTQTEILALQLLKS